MEEHYLVNNTTCLKFSANPHTNSSLIFVKKEKYNTQSIIAFLRLAEILFPKGSEIKSAFFTKTAFLTLFFLFFSFVGFSQTSPQLFNDPTKNGTATNTFTVPAGVTTLTVEAWGGGGAGGGCTTLSRATGGGGGGGTYTKNIAVSVTPGNVITVIVGSGGIGFINANGGIGGTSSFASGIPVTAIGGNGGNVNGATTPLNGAGAIVATGVTFNGGAGGTGDATASNSGNSGGGGGGAGSTTSGATPTTGINAGVGGTGGGGNGASGTATSGDGNSAVTLSGGGGGGRNGGTSTGNRIGGNGYQGQVIVTWCTTYSLTSTTVTTPICAGSASIVTLNSTVTANLPTGTYTVTYDLGAPNAASGNTATMVVTTAGMGTFTTTALANSGSTAITIKNLTKGGTCPSPITLNNSTNVTVNSMPSAITGGATTVCVGANTAAFTDATAGGTWSVTNGTGSATITAGGIVTGVTAGNVTVNYTLGTCPVSTAITVVGNITTLATAPTPANGANGVCYDGTGAISDINWTAAAGALSYDVYFGTNPVPAFTVNQTATSYVPSTLLANTTYYWKIVPISSCGSSTGVPVVWSFTTATAPCYCTPSSSGTAYPLSNVTFAGINKTTSASTTGAPFYEDFTSIFGSVIPNGIYTFSATATGISPNPFGIYVFFDWNNNGDLTDDGGPTTIGNYTTTASGVLSASIVIPATAIIGSSIRMRVANQFSNVPTSCPSSGSFQDEDYTINIIAGPACTTPTNQPTALVLTPGGTFINGSFTLATSAPDHYLVVINTTGVTPTPNNTTTYAVGDNLGGTNIIVDNDTNTTFTAGQLNLSTAYYIYVFSYNAGCSGGPLYTTVPPLNGTKTTTATLPTYCTPVTTSTPVNTLYVSSVAFVGTLLDTSNTSLAGTSGYQDFTGSSPKCRQAQAGPINMKVTSDTGRGFWKVWVDWNKDGDFVDSGEEVYNPGGYLFASTTFGFIVPANAAPGDYRMRIRVQNTFRNSDGQETLVSFDSCNSFDPIVIGGTSYKTYGEAEDYLFTVIAKCDNKITSITNPAICGTGTATLSATGTGTNVKWYDSLTGGTLLATTANGANFTASIPVTTTYYITSWSASCETLTRTPIIAEVKPVPSLIIANPNPTICGENSIIQLDATGNNEVAYLINEDFEAGTLGVFSSLNGDGTTIAQKAKTAWKNKTSVFVPNGTTWFPAISSGFGTNKFVLTSMDDFKSVPFPTVPMQNSLTLTTAVNPAATAFTNLTLSLRMYYSRYYDDGANPTLENCKIEISTDGGTSWPISLAAITADQGYGSNFVTLTYNLTAYIAATNLKIRIKVLGDGSAGGTAGDGAAIDDVKLYGERPLTPYFALGGGVNAFTNAATTTAYTGDQRNTIWIKPTLTQLEQATFVINVNANLNNGCTTSGTINVTNTTKIWKGTTDNDWNKASNWLPASVPAASTCVIIPTGTTSKIMNTPDAFAKTVTIKAPSGNLELQTGKNLTVTNNIIVENLATFNIRDKASLIQTNNIANTGIVNIDRTSQPMNYYDYTYWSTPVTKTSNFTLGNLSTGSSLMYSWTPYTTSTGQGNWLRQSATKVMDPGIGYIVKAPDTYSTNITGKVSYTATFTGTPNNGDITTPISKGNLNGTASTATVDGTDENDEWNLIGNPYPSALDAAKFLNLPANTSVIDGTLYLWTHFTQPNAANIDPFYGDYVLNYTDNDYASLNKTGGTATAASNAGGSPPTGYIASGQSFFVKAATIMPNGTTGAFATFNNSMRVGVQGKNDNFFKLTKNNKEEAIPKTVTDIERHRVWINLTNNSGAFSQTLLGYVAGATQGLDRSFDGESLGGNDVSFYSIIPEAQLTIQGRALPFDENDQVPLGYNSEISGDLSIRIDHIDGLFDTQNIYLEDKDLSVIHNLKEAPYVFKTEKGDFDDRFALRFTDKTLGTNTFNLSKSDEVNVIVNQNVTVQSSTQLIKNIAVYDLSGRKIDSYKKVNALKYTLSHLNKTTAGLIVKITLDNDTVVSKKIIY
jgi:hypothetical protein